MSTFVLISGSLFKNPEEKTSSKTGRTFVSAVIKVESGDAAEFWQVTAFSQPQAGRHFSPTTFHFEKERTRNHDHKS
jgi:hypothetical protein